MGFVHYLGRAPSRQRLIDGDVPYWIANSPRSRYIASVVLSAPPWVDRRELFAMHATAQAMSRASGTLHVLDHIVPLNHPLVCGLTVPWNLRIVPWRVNAAKSNDWQPDQLELF